MFTQSGSALSCVIIVSLYTAKLLMVSAAVGCRLGMAVTQQCDTDIGNVQGGIVQGSGCGAIAQWLEHSCAKTRGPGFVPQLRCLNFFFPPSQCQCFLSSTGVLEWFN